jgi:hypothetical protein
MRREKVLHMYDVIFNTHNFDEFIYKRFFFLQERKQIKVC